MPTEKPARDLVTSQLRPLLQRQLSKLRRRYFLHGTAKATMLVALLVLGAFVLDNWLRLPTPIRLLHTLAIAAVAVYGALRFVRYPLQRRFSDVDLAMWLERTYPDLHQRLVSALQLHADADQGELRNQSRAMVDQLWQETAERTRALRLDELYDNRSLGRVFAAAALLLLTLTAGAIGVPTVARAFTLRHLGLDVDYPRATTLVVELPPAGPDLRREDRGDTTELVMPAGADLHVSVHALDVVPKDVSLVVTPRREQATGTNERRGARQRNVQMTPRPGDRFRYVFRRVSGSFEFHAKGGDDEHGDRRVIVRTVRPAQVATLAAAITPPAYTGVDRIEQNGGAIEALAGSEVELLVQATAPVREATMVFLESGRRLELSQAAIDDDGGTVTAFVGRFTIEASDRFQIELLAENGLRNPNPGTYPISALQDYAPVGRWLLPEDDTLALLPTGLLCLRVHARDDFGLTAVDLQVERDGAPVLRRPLLSPAGDGAPSRSLLPTELLEVQDLLAAGDGTAGAGLIVQLLLTDNKLPEAGTAELPRRIVQIVDPPQLAALIARSFRRLREEVVQAVDVQTDRRARLTDLLLRLPEGQLLPGELPQVLTGVEVGQGRIGSAIQRLHRGLMRAFDLHLWNRLETSPNAASVVELYREHAATLQQPIAFDPTFYRDLIARRQAGTLGALETTLDPILSMLELTDRLGQEHAPAVAGLLARAQVARDDDERTPLLRQVSQHQQQIEEGLQQLLLRLEEWNDYQDLVQEVRALRDRQRDLQSRTEEARGK